MFYILALITCNIEDAITLVQHSTSTLHTTTSITTFYELFNLTEAATASSIKKKFYALIKQDFPVKNLSKIDGTKLVTDGYNVLTKYKKTYDYFLKHHSYPKETKSYKLLIVLMLMFILLFIDIGVMIFRNVRQGMLTKKELKKVMRRGEHLNGISLGELWVVKVAMKVKRTVFG